MKKIIALVLSLCLLCGAAALAETTLNQNTSSGSTTLTYQFNPASEPTSYVVTIPASISFDAAGKASGEIVIGANPVLPADKKLKIEMTSDYKLEKNDDSSVTIGYAYQYSDNSTATGSPLLLANYGASVLTSATSVKLNFVLTEEAPAAGEYSDRITFNVSVQ